MLEDDWVDHLLGSFTPDSSDQHVQEPLQFVLVASFYLFLCFTLWKRWSLVTTVAILGQTRVAGKAVGSDFSATAFSTQSRSTRVELEPSWEQFRPSSVQLIWCNHNPEYKFTRTWPKADQKLDLVNLDTRSVEAPCETAALTKVSEHTMHGRVLQCGFKATKQSECPCWHLSITEMSNKGHQTWTMKRVACWIIFSLTACI